MKKLQKINLAVFLAFIVFVIPLSYVMGSDFMGKQEKPWHMQGAIHEDSLSQEYLSKYKILDKVPVTLQIERHKEKRVLILIDDISLIIRKHWNHFPSGKWRHKKSMVIRRQASSLSGMILNLGPK